MTSASRLARGALVTLAALAAWVFADLYLRVDLPGAGVLQHLAFRGATDPLQWLDVDRSRIRPDAPESSVVTVAGAILVVVTAGLGRRGAIPQRGLALAFCAPILVAVVVGALLERAIFAGWLVGSGVLVARGLLFGPTPRDAGRLSLAAPVMGAVLGVGALVCLFLVISADSSGYSVPERLRMDLAARIQL